MKNSGFRILVACMAFGLFAAPGLLVAQQGHEGEAAAGEHDDADPSHQVQEHAE